VCLIRNCNCVPVVCTCVHFRCFDGFHVADRSSFLCCVVLFACLCSVFRVPNVVSQYLWIVARWWVSYKKQELYILRYPPFLINKVEKTDGAIKNR
jgi:hypothetical protein